MKIFGCFNYNYIKFSPINPAQRHLCYSNNLLNKKNVISFCSSNIKTKLPQFRINYRIKQLTKLGLSDFYARRLSKVDNNKYQKIIELVSLGVFEEGLEDTIELEEEQYKQALELISHNVINEDLASLAKLEGKAYRRVIELKDKGVDTEQVGLFANLSDEEYEEAKKMMKNGYTPIESASFARLSEEQKEIALNLCTMNTPVEIAADIALMDVQRRNLSFELIRKGISAEEALYIANLEDKQEDRLDEIISMNVGDENVSDFAKFSEQHYKKAVSLFSKGVLPEYISEIIAIEDGKKDNPEYKEYRKRGYSRSISYALSLLDSDELEELSKIMRKNKRIKEILFQEYDINLIELQDSKELEAIFSREIRCKNGTKITFVQTFDNRGNSTKSRLEEYSNHSTSSTLSGISGVYKAKYDKFGEIRELAQFIQDPETHSVIGVLHSKVSELLPGVFESIYYDISKFKESNSNIDNEVDYDIENSVITKGTPMSSVVQREDGTIVYQEYFRKNGLLTKREYRERKNTDGEIIYSYYSYNIKDRKNKNLMDIKRVYRKLNDKVSINIINGVTYRLIYDDENKEITVSDGKNSKKISFKDKLAYYSQDKLWKTIKTLPVDTILTIEQNAKKWNYCREEDSCADGYTHTISTGTKQSVILHETGHFKDYETQFSINNKTFLKFYSKEMKAFLNSIPYNEQEFVQYFSPRATLNDATGTNEFVAEANIILTTYGTDYERLKTRSQFLVRYFPETLAIVADLLRKTSQKSLLAED